MDRLVWVVVACIVLVGCQAPKPNFDPFAITGQTRIPSPATGAVGRPGSYYPPAPTPLPPLNSGASTWSQERSLSPNRLALASAVQASPLTDRVSVDASEPTMTQRGDRLTWLDKRPGDSQEHVPIQEDPSVVSYPTSSSDQHAVASTSPLNRPRPLPNPGPHQSLASRSLDAPPRVSPAPRIRGFVNSGVRDLRIPATLADFNRGGIPQLDAASNQWQARYGSTR